MSIVSDIPSNRKLSACLPPHGMLKDQSLTTKLRVVFDGSCPTSTGISLNDVQLVGPKLQNDLFSILIRFRQHTYTVSADVKSMYRQIEIKPSQRTLQQIIWRFHKGDPLSTYQLNTVTYGTASASFLAIRCLVELATENASKYPDASQIILNDFYVDDIISGHNDVSELSKLCLQI